jgi:anti-anti-sigma factor
MRNTAAAQGWSLRIVMELEPGQNVTPPVRPVERVTDGVPEGMALLALAGELDLASADVVRSAIDEARGSGARRVVLDLTDVEFVDSSMLKELLRANAELPESGSALVLAAPQAPVQRLLELTRTSELFTVAADRATACA